MAEKEELLAAIAAAGSQGRVDYEAAQAANRAAQQQAIQGALAGAAWAPQAMQNQVAQTVASPYQVSNEHLAANEAAQQTWTNESRWNTGVFQGNLEKLRDALTARSYAEAAAEAANGSGSGRSSKPKDPPTWYDNVKDQFGTGALAKAGIAGEVQNDPHVSGMPNYLADRQYAEEKYGVPEGIANEWYNQSKDEAQFADTVMKKAQGVKNKRQLRKVLANNRKFGNANPTVPNRGYYQAQAAAAARARLAAKRARKKHH